MSTKKWKEENVEKMRAYRREYYYKNKQSHYDRNKITEAKIKEYIADKKDKCCVCGEQEKCCLDFHHIDPIEKDMEIARLYKYGSLKRIMKEIEKCVVLCANCHRKVHAKLIKINTGLV